MRWKWYMVQYQFCDCRGTKGSFLERCDEMFFSFSSANFPAERARLRSACALLQNLSGKKKKRQGARGGERLPQSKRVLIPLSSQTAP